MKNARRETQSHSLLALTLMLAFFLRIHKLGAKSVWFDEGWNAWMSRYSPGEIIERVSTDTAPPLHFFLLHGWRAVAGESEFALRYISALAGFLAVAVTYQIGRKIGGRNLGLVAAFIITISRFQVSWSQEIRMYTLGNLFAALGLWAALRCWDRNRGQDYVLYIVAMVLGLYTHYLAAFVLLAYNIAWVWEFFKGDGGWRPRVNWILAQFAVVGLFAPWLLYALGRMRSWSAESPITLGSFFKITWTILTVGIPSNIEKYATLTSLLGAVVGIGLLLIIWSARTNWRTARNVSALVVGLLIPAMLIFLLSIPGRDFLYTPPVAPRYFVLFVTAYSVLVAWSIGRIAKVTRWYVGLVALALTAWVAWQGLGVYYPGRIAKDQYVSLANTIHAYQQPTDTILFYTDTDWPTFDFYVGPGWHGIPSSWVLDAAQTDNYLQPLWDDHDAIWVASNSFALASDPDKLLPTWLSERSASETTYAFGDMSLTLYAKSPSDMRTQTTTQLPADGAILNTQNVRPLDKPNAIEGAHLVGYEQPLRVYESGDIIHLFLHWEQLDEVSDPIEVGLVDLAGKVWGAELYSSAVFGRMHTPLIVPPEAPDGRYRFKLLWSGVEFGAFEVRQRVRNIVQLSDINYEVPVDAQFGDGIRLLGYDLDAVPTDATTIPLTLYWQTTQPVTKRYKVFTHLLGSEYNGNSGNFLWGQQDNEPVAGSRPTSQWRTDEVIIDRYSIPVAADAPAGQYRIEIGLYDPITGVRLPIVDANGTPTADHIVLTSINLDSP